MGGGALALLALLVSLARGCDAAGSSRSDELSLPSEQDRETSLVESPLRRGSDINSGNKNVQAEQEAICAEVKQCFCMRHTLHKMTNVCGWCENSREPMLGSTSGPSKGQCGRWIFNHRECPTYWCEEDWTVAMLLSLVLPPLTFGLAWFWALCRQSQKRAPQKPDFLRHRRTVEEFSKGLWGDRPLLNKAPFQNYFPYAPRLCYLMVRLTSSSILHDVFVGSMRFGFLTSLFFTLLRLAPAFTNKMTYKVISATLEEIKNLSDTIKVAVGFLFSFYALGRVNWWWDVINHCRSMQGRSHDLGVIIGGYSAVKECPHSTSAKAAGWVWAKWHFYRILMMDWILCFRGLSSDFGTITLDDLENAGFLEADEKQILAKSFHVRKVCLKWLSTWIEYHIDDMTVRALAMDKLCGLRGAMASLHDTCELRAPMSFEGLMYTLVVAWVSTIPFGRLESIDDRKVVLEQNVLIPTFSAVCTCFFYLSMVALLETFKEPFGTSTDSLNTETIFLECETSMWDYFTSPAPGCLGHTLTAEQFTLPPGSGSPLEGNLASFEVVTTPKNANQRQQ